MDQCAGTPSAVLFKPRPDQHLKIAAARRPARLEEMAHIIVLGGIGGVSCAYDPKKSVRREDRIAEVASVFGLLLKRSKKIRGEPVRPVGREGEKTSGGQPGLPMPCCKSGAYLYDIHISRGFLPSRFFMIFRPI